MCSVFGMEAKAPVPRVFAYFEMESYDQPVCCCTPDRWEDVTFLPLKQHLKFIKPLLKSQDHEWLYWQSCPFS